MFRKKTHVELRDEMIEELEENTDATGLVAGSSIYVLVDLFARKVAELYGDTEFNVGMSRPSSAKGVYLDILAEDNGLRRVESQPAIVYASDRILRFYCTTGVLKDYIPTGVIGAGVEIYNSDQSITFRVTGDTYFSDTDNEVYVTAGATAAGSESNVGKGELSSHSLASSSVLVQNTAAIQNGAAEESNENLRYRLASAPLELSTGNMQALKNALSVLPGVSDVIITPYEQGVSSVGIKVVPVSNILTDDLVGQIAALSGGVRSAGDYLHITAPEYCRVQISVQLIFDQGVAEGDKAALTVPCENAILGYLGQLRMGQMFVLNEMIQRVMDVSDLILDMQVRCYNFRGRPQVLRNFIPYDDEVYIPDPEVDKAIEVYF